MINTTPADNLDSNNQQNIYKHCADKNLQHICRTRTQRLLTMVNTWGQPSSYNNSTIRPLLYTHTHNGHILCLQRPTSTQHSHSVPDMQWTVQEFIYRYSKTSITDAFSFIEIFMKFQDWRQNSKTKTFWLMIPMGTLHWIHQELYTLLKM